MAGSDHYFRTCPFVPTFQNLAKQNNFFMMATGRTVGLTKWIIDGTHVCSYWFLWKIVELLKVSDFPNFDVIFDRKVILKKFTSKSN